MELLLDKQELLKNKEYILGKELNLDKLNKIDLDISSTKNNFEKVINSVIEKGSDYVIKAMPINNSLKDILVDVKNAFKTKDFKQIMKTAINSSIREGLEIVGAPISVIKDVNKIKDIALQGGLKQAISAGIEIIEKKYIKNNIFSDVIKTFFDKTKDFINSNMFHIKINDGIKKIKEKLNSFKELSKKWYEFYDKFDLDNLNNVSKKLNEYKKVLSLDKQSLKENDIIQNMTELINNKKDKLSQIQLQMCKTL